MFHAVVGGKFKFDQLNEGEKTRRREDLVTSSLFSLMDLLPLSARREALRLISRCGHKLSDAELDTCNIILWPRFRHVDGAPGAVEPDVILQFGSGERAELWIIEVKWGAPFGADQIGREIRSVRHNDCDGEGFGPPERLVRGYTLLGAEGQHEKYFEVAKACFQGVDFQKISWPELTYAIERACRRITDDPIFHRWGKIVVGFLRKTKGTPLGTWPELLSPSAFHFLFEAPGPFGLPAGIISVTDAYYQFYGE